jgi:hypothetical protein
LITDLWFPCIFRVPPQVKWLKTLRKVLHHETLVLIDGLAAVWAAPSGFPHPSTRRKAQRKQHINC